jgi:putrescine transport system permease protein
MARAQNELSPFNITALALGLAFLYLPIVILVLYSFNASRLVTVWGGWSLRWYSEFFHDRAMLDAAWMSLRVAAASATMATLLGTLAAVALSRGERFKGRTLFSGMLYAPMVMPEVITGLSLLLLFVALNAERGFWTVTIAHTTLTMCFVAVVVQSRLGALDRSLEEAAMDLGCDPARAFVAVTLPLIAPAIAAGWMLAFTLSLDDVVIASFTTGPDAADPDLFGGAARGEARDQRHLYAGDRLDRGGDRGGIAGLEADEGARRERGAIVVPSFRGDANGWRERAPDDRLRIEPRIPRFPDAQLRI